MKVHYEEQKIEYKSLKEMADHAILMQEQGWKAERLKEEKTNFWVLYKKGSR